GVENWIGVGTQVGTIDRSTGKFSANDTPSDTDEWAIQGAWFYVDDGAANPPTLKVLNPDGADILGKPFDGLTTDIFTHLTIPESFGNEMADFALKLELQALAVQAENNRDFQYDKANPEKSGLELKPSTPDNEAWTEFAGFPTPNWKLIPVTPTPGSTTTT
ncbi:MAG: hypothetical protein LBT44_04425, partial [Clostridiales bacterium]|nr:hypothetical protein [Clostridiales bacterium]